MLKKIFSSIVLIILIVGISKNVNAVEKKYVLNIVKKESETVHLNNDQGYLNSKIISCDNENGIVNVQLCIDNTKIQNLDKASYENTEVYILIPESITVETEKLNEYANYIEELATKILNNNSKIKIGLIGIKGTIRDGKLDSDGNVVWGENDEGKVKGTSKDSEIIVNSTNDINKLKNGLMNMNSKKINYNYNLQAAVMLAQKSYSNDVNKILISMYDDVPRIAIGIEAEGTYGDGTIYKTVEEAVNAKNKSIVVATKSEIENLKENNIDFILLRPKDTSFDKKYYNSQTGEFLLDFDGSAYVKELYGTMDNPTYGKMYSTEKDSIEKIVTEYMYKDVMNNSGTIINNIKINQYFTKDILDNFEIEILSKNNINIDNSSLKTNGLIKYSIPKLENGEKLILEYTLKLKDMNNVDILDKIIKINEKVDLSYEDYLKETNNITLASTPTIQLVQQKENIDNTKTENSSENKDGTTAKGTIPQTGDSIKLWIAIIITVLILVVIYKKYREYKDIK